VSRGSTPTESLSPPPATTTTAAAAAAAAFQEDPVQDPESAWRARAEPPQSCSTEGPTLIAPTSYETYEVIDMCGAE